MKELRRRGPSASTLLVPLLLVSFARSLSMPSPPVCTTPWQPLHPDSFVSAPCLIEQTLCQQPSNDDNGPPQLAASVEYATAVLDAWRADDENSDWCDMEWRDVQYADAAAAVPLYGHWVRRANDNNAHSTIILFHTGAGPHDLFLLWKAAHLVANLPSGCRVLIADVLSDATGWAWSSDRTQYQRVRQELDTTPGAWQGRVAAALEVANQSSGKVVAALGWCLGGRAILECAQHDDATPPALVTFHGVFATTEPKGGGAESTSPTASEILVCHGVNDPFVPPEQLEAALELFQTLGHRTSLLQLQAKHGFTNPAQEFNPNPAFAYDATAADKAWRQAVALVRRTIEQEAAKKEDE